MKTSGRVRRKVIRRPTRKTKKGGCGCGCKGKK